MQACVHIHIYVNKILEYTVTWTASLENIVKLAGPLSKSVNQFCLPVALTSLSSRIINLGVSKPDTEVLLSKQKDNFSYH